VDVLLSGSQRDSRGYGGRSQTGIGELDEHGTPIGWVSPASDQSTLLCLVDQAGGAGGRRDQRAGDLDCSENVIRASR